MNNSLFYLSEWQKSNSSLATRYQLNLNTNLEELESNEEIDTNFFIELITLFNSEKDLPVENLKKFPTSIIIDYLVKTHRFYIETQLPEIEQAILNIYHQIPENNTIPFLITFFNWIKNNLLFHISKEETQLFPYIEALENNTLDQGKFSIIDFTENHSDEVEVYINEIKKQIINSKKSSCELFPYNVLLRKLDSFEKDLRIHARIEEEVLIPLALSLENKLL